MAHYVFMLTGYPDTATDLEENVNGIGGKQMLEALRRRLSTAGYTCDPEVGAEDWGWYFGAARNGRNYLCGGHVARDADDSAPCEAQAFLELERGMLDKLLGRNKADPGVDPDLDLKAALESMPGVAGLTKEQH
jgi:hypothetical protein